MERKQGCKYCNWPPKDIQVKGGGKYGRAYLRDNVAYVVDGDRNVTFRIKYCPMCGRRLVD